MLMWGFNSHWPVFPAVTSRGQLLPTAPNIHTNIDVLFIIYFSLCH